MKELFIENIQFDKIELICKNYLSETSQYILLLTNDGEYRITQNRTHDNKFEKIENEYISNYVTSIYDKSIFVNDLKQHVRHTLCTPIIQKELMVTKKIYKLYLKTKIHFILETIQTLPSLHNDFVCEPNHIQKRGYFELKDKTDENNKIVEKELIQWFKLID